MTKNFIKKLALTTLLIPLFFISSLSAKNTEYLEEMSKGFAEIAKKATPSVVYIKAHYTQNISSNNFEGFEDPLELFGEDFFKHFFGGPRKFKNKQTPQQNTQISGGSGFVISKDGYIITNYHVVKDADKITATLNNGEECDARLIGIDAKTDIAVIKIDKNDMSHLSFGNSDELKICEWVIAIGNPFTLQSTVTVGVVSAKGRNNLQISDQSGYEDFIQTDAAINLGNSGGPLLNLNGEVIGINTAILSKSGGYMGIGFAIPSHMAKHVTDQIIKYGSVKRGYIGIFFQPIDKDMAETLNMEKAEGVLISEVPNNSPAHKAGIKQGDIIIEYNDNKITDARDFRNKIALMSPNDKVKFKVLRNNKIQYITLSLEAYADKEISAKEMDQLGIEVAEIKDIPSNTLNKWGYNENMNNIIITSVKPNSLAERSGIKPGMLLLQLNQIKLKDIADFHEALKDIDKKKHVLLLIKHQNMTKFITVKLN